MNIENRTVPSIGEAYSKATINGLDTYVIKKKLTTAYAVLGVNFGSSDVQYEKDGKIYGIPQGTAHFLEHKMFEDENGNDTFETFSSLGVNANAFTTSSKTCYMFSCSENFSEALPLLIKTVQSPHFTEASVEREKPIINKEIRMYRDDVYWNLFFDLINSLYSINPIKNDPAGTEETVATVTPDILYNVHKAFYTPENMILCVCGDVDENEVFAIVEKAVQSGTGLPKRVITTEPEEPVVRSTERKMDVARPLFGIGIKHSAPNKTDTVRAELENEIILQMIFGKSGSFYNNCYETGLLGDRFASAYTGERNAAFVMISGSSKEPETVYKKLIDEINRRRENFGTEEEFERAKKVCYSSALDTFNSTEDIANAFLSFSFDGGNLYDYIEQLREADYESTKKRFLKEYKTENTTFSVIIPKEDK